MIGIDPGKQTGISTYRDGALVELRTVSPGDVYEVLLESGATRVVMEDSRLQSAVFPRAVGPRAMLKIARNVGEVDQICRRIEAVCETAGIDLVRVSPLGKGAKLNAARFKEITGWTGRSNQHERDAAMCAFPYRRATDTRGSK
ncbi:MAG: hypothetical protein IPN63_07590 [Gammaproteobacteria bacterium]|nr:hypothetical protein [Gammaproteobacteria bacterium]